MEDALVALRDTANPERFVAVVAALGTDDATLLFDRGGDRSSLISEANGKRPKCLSIVYSHTACRNIEYRRACEDAGADAVVSTPEELMDLIRDAGEQAGDVTAASSPAPPAAAAAGNDDTTQAGAETDSHMSPAPGGYPHYRTPLEYGPIARRMLRDGVLERLLGADHRAVTKAKRWTKRLLEQVQGLSRSLTVPPPDATDATPPRSVRCVFISDTHRHHRAVDLPPGDVLLHCGDCVGNYGNKNIQKHFREFVAWLVEMSQRYKHVIFIAGNHDTLLDGACYDTAEAKKAMEGLPKNVIYLENTGVEVMGVRFWGSPVTPSRQESLGKRYYSDGFERRKKDRKRIWQMIPDIGSKGDEKSSATDRAAGGVDVLMTHVPPQDSRVCNWSSGDPLLSERLAQLKQPPRYHCFGHDHDYFGVAESNGGRTIYLNGAQETLRRMDAYTDRMPKIRHAFSATDAHHRVSMPAGCALEFDVVCR